MCMRTKEDKLKDQNELLKELIKGIDQIKEGKTMPFEQK